jgi:hypothetical protein
MGSATRRPPASRHGQFLPLSVGRVQRILGKNGGGKPVRRVGTGREQAKVGRGEEGGEEAECWFVERLDARRFSSRSREPARRPVVKILHAGYLAERSGRE